MIEAKELADKAMGLPWKLPVDLCLFSLTGKPEISELEARASTTTAKLTVVLATAIAVLGAIISFTVSLGNSGFHFRVIRDILQTDPAFAIAPLVWSALFLTIIIGYTYWLATYFEKQTHCGSSVRWAWAGILLLASVSIVVMHALSLGALHALTYVARNTLTGEILRLVAVYLAPVLYLILFPLLFVRTTFRTIRVFAPPSMGREQSVQLKLALLSIWALLLFFSIREQAIIENVHPNPDRNNNELLELVAVYLTGLACERKGDEMGCLVTATTGQPQDMTLAGFWTSSIDAEKGPSIPMARWKPVSPGMQIVPIVRINPFSQTDIELRAPIKDACALATAVTGSGHSITWHFETHGRPNGKWTDDRKRAKLFLNNPQSFNVELADTCRRL